MNLNAYLICTESVSARGLKIVSKISQYEQLLIHLKYLHHFTEYQARRLALISHLLALHRKENELHKRLIPLKLASRCTKKAGLQEMETGCSSFALTAIGQVDSLPLHRFQLLHPTVSCADHYRALECAIIRVETSVATRTSAHIAPFPVLLVGHSCVRHPQQWPPL